MLDNFNILVQRDPQNALLVASEQWKQALFQAEVISPENDGVVSFSTVFIKVS